MRKNQKYSKEQMFAAIERCQKESITPKQYCHQNDIPYPSFQYWIRKYRSAQLNDNIVSEQKFVSVHVEQRADITTQQIVVHFPNGIQVSCPFSTPAHLLQALIIS